MVRRTGLTLAAIGLIVASLAGCDPRRLAAQRVAAQQAAVAEAEAAAAAAAAAEQVAIAAARTSGTQAARQDIAGGILRLKEYPPLPSPPWHAKFVALLKTECDAEWVVVQGPADSAALRAEVAAYNVVMTAEIEQRFGLGILQQLRDKAEGK